MSSSKITKVALGCLAGLVSYRLYLGFDRRIRRVLITGANKGIGFAIAKFLLQHTTNYRVILSGRNPVSLNAAYEKLLNMSPAFEARMTTLIMDVSKEQDVKDAAIRLHHTFNDNLDLYSIVNNAGIFPEAKKYKHLKNAQETINTNFWGTVYVTKYFAPYLNRNDSRIVNISSGGGPVNVSKMSEENQRIILNPNVTMDDLQGLIDAFLNAYTESRFGDEYGGFRLHAYGFSKALVNSFTCFIAPKLLEQNRNVLINCCTPGMVDTSMTKHVKDVSKKKTILQGIQVPIALLVEELKQSGKFFGGCTCQEYRLDKYEPMR